VLRHHRRVMSGCFWGGPARGSLCFGHVWRRIATTTPGLPKNIYAKKMKREGVRGQSTQEGHRDVQVWPSHPAFPAGARGRRLVTNCDEEKKKANSEKTGGGSGPGEIVNNPPGEDGRGGVTTLCVGAPDRVSGSAGRVGAQQRDGPLKIAFFRLSLDPCWVGVRELSTGYPKIPGAAAPPGHHATVLSCL